MKGLDWKVSYMVEKVKMSGHALVNGNDIDLSENEGIAEYDAANTTWGESENREKWPAERPWTHQNYKVKVKRKQMRGM